MDRITYDALRVNLHSKALEIANAKRPGYTVGADDVLANFKRVAERSGLTPLQVWAVYFLKHIDAITTAACKPELPQAEAIEGRFCDALNYLDLGFALIEEAALAKLERQMVEIPPDVHSPINFDPRYETEMPSYELNPTSPLARALNAGSRVVPIGSR